jgi:hypothetical protein
MKIPDEIVLASLRGGSISSTFHHELGTICMLFLDINVMNNGMNWLNGIHYQMKRSQSRPWYT